MKGRIRIARAFSIFEVILAIVIIGVLSAATVPVFSSTIARRCAEAAARRVLADLALARKRAMQTDTPQTVTFDVASDSYTFAGTRHFWKVSPSYTVKLSEDPYRVQMAYAAFVASGDPAEDPVVVFDIYGVPDSGGWVVVEAGTYRWWISLDATTGKAEISRNRPLAAVAVTIK